MAWDSLLPQRLRLSTKLLISLVLLQTLFPSFSNAQTAYNESQLPYSSLTNTSFVHWYGFYNFLLTGTSQGPCRSTFFDYQSTITPGKCKDHAYCLLSNIGEINKADMASATVLLGLAPSTLTALAPRVDELAVLSHRRLLLAFLISMGSSGVSVSRLMEYSNPLAGLRTKPKVFVTHDWHNAVGVMLQYLFMVAAVLNVFLNSAQLGHNTVLSWRCNNNNIPLVWCVMPVAIYVLAAGSFVAARRFSRRETVREDKESEKFERLGWKEKVLDEFRMCGYRSCVFPSFEHHVPVLAIVASYLAAAMAFVHVFLGTLVLSSTLFIGTLDSLGVILRMVASSLVCRALLTVELAGMSVDEQGGENAGSSTGSRDQQVVRVGGVTKRC